MKLVIQRLPHLPKGSLKKIALTRVHRANTMCQLKFGMKNLKTKYKSSEKKKELLVMLLKGKSGSLSSWYSALRYVCVCVRACVCVCVCMCVCVRACMCVCL